MKRGLFSLSFVVAIAVIGNAVSASVVHAQEVAANAFRTPVTIDSVAPASTSAAESQKPHNAAEPGALGMAPTIHSSAESQAADGGIKGYLFGTQRRASNTLMIGGVAIAGIGVGLVKGEVGAVLGVIGLLSTVGGLYLAF